MTSLTLTHTHSRGQGTGKSYGSWNSLQRSKLFILWLFSRWLVSSDWWTKRLQQYLHSKVKWVFSCWAHSGGSRSKTSKWEYLIFCWRKPILTPPSFLIMLETVFKSFTKQLLKSSSLGSKLVLIVSIWSGRENWPPAFTLWIMNWMIPKKVQTRATAQWSFVLQIEFQLIERWKVGYFFWCAPVNPEM